MSEEDERRLAVLRMKAEAVVSETDLSVEDSSPDEVRRLVQELSTYQVELEMQNEDLRQARLELEEARDRFRDLYDHAPVGYLTLDQGGVIGEANFTAATLLGVDRSRLLGRLFHLCVFPGDQDAFSLYRKDLLASDAGLGSEIRLLRGDEGQIFWAALESLPIQRAGEEPSIRLSFHDITKRMRAIQEAGSLHAGARGLLEEEEFTRAARRVFDTLRELIGATTGYVTILSPGGGEDEVQFLVSGGVPRNFDPALSMPIQGLRAEAYREGKVVFRNDIPSAERVESFPGGLERLDSVLFAPLCMGDEPAGLIGLANKPGGFTREDARVAGGHGDLAALALRGGRTRDALEASENRYRHLVEAVTDAVFALDHDMRFTFASTNVSMLGKALPEEYLGVEIFDLYPSMKGSTFQMLCQVTEGREPASLVAEHEFEDGNRAWFDWRVYPTDEGVLCIVSDVTDRKKAEEDALRVQKLEATGVLAGGIAHDFNNLLGVIMGNISLSRTCIQPTGEAAELLDEAERGCSRARGLTQQLMTFARGGAPIKKSASMARLLHECVGFALRGSNVACEFAIDDDLWWVDVDEGQMGQVIDNLVINADQAMPDGGVLRVGATNSNRMPHEAFPEGRYVRVSIEDQGVGIAAEHLQKVFDPYFSTKKKGSGLGLATCHSIMTRHGGQIRVDSTVGQGSTFELLVPASKWQGRAEQEVRSAIVKGSGRVLIMDDEEAVRRVAERMVTSLGYEVATVDDGSGAVGMYRWARETAHPFDLLILDLTVPGEMGGKEAMEALLEIDPQVKAIVSSGYSDDPIMASYADHGFKDVLVKPYDLRRISTVLSKVLKP